MRTSFRQTLMAATAMIGLTGFAATAAQPAAGDPTAVLAPASTTSATMTDPGRNKAETVEQRIKDLHARLRISDAEQPLWNEFARVMRENARSMEETFQQRVKTLPTMTATENMRSYAGIATEHAREVETLMPAFQALYATMPDEQKRLADQVFRDDAHQARHG